MAATLAVAALSVSACGGDSGGATWAQGTASPESASSGPASPAVKRSSASPDSDSDTDSNAPKLTKKQACDKANDAFNKLLNGMIDIAPPTQAGEAPLSGAERDKLRRLARRTSVTISQAAERTDDAATKSALREVSKAAAAYMKVTDLSKAEAEGEALNASVKKAGAVCT